MKQELAYEPAKLHVAKPIILNKENQDIRLGVRHVCWLVVSVMIMKPLTLVAPLPPKDCLQGVIAIHRLVDQVLYGRVVH